APFGFTVPILTAVIFSGLLVGIFTDVSRSYAGEVLFANYWVALVMVGFFGLCALYTFYVVPIFKKKAEEIANTRTKRRPGKKTAATGSAE
ncbi:MAG: hypothetical protein PHY31_10340, partial [Smithellaceae bacterium]|nr:hypothetical protein [Smithellaceae bacterium]